MSWLTEIEIADLGFKRVGTGVRLSRKASYYNCAGISIDDNSRIDDFCVVSAGAGGISIGRYVHVSAMASLVGQARIDMEDFSSVSNKVAVFSSSDDFFKGMSNPTVPDELRSLIHRPVRICRHCVVGSNSVLLPGSVVGEGTSVGALSVIRGELKPWSVYLGNPARRIGERSKDILDLERQLWS